MLPLCCVRWPLKRNAVCCEDIYASVFRRRLLSQRPGQVVGDVNKPFPELGGGAVEQ